MSVLAPILVVLLTAAPALGAEGVSASEIVLGASTSLSGPRAFGGAQATKFGVDLYLRVVNAAGGIDGRKVRTVYHDDADVPDRAVANARKLVEEAGVLALIVPQGERAILASLPYLEQQRVPLLFALGGSPTLRGRKYVFGATMLYDRQSRLMVDYLVGQRKYRRFATLYQDDAYGRTFLTALASDLGRRGLRLVGSERLRQGESDVSDEIARLRALRPDVAFLISTPRPAGEVLKERLRVGWSETVIVAVGPLLDEGFLTVAGGVADGVEGLALWPDPLTSDLPGVKRYREHLAKHFPGTVPNRASLSGYVAAMLFTEGARRAGPTLTRESLVAALEGLKDFETGILPPVTIASDHETQKQGFWVRMEQGRFKPLTGWLPGK